MAWVKLDDAFPDHPKMVGLSAEAGWLWVRCLAYCNRYRTDGKIPRAYVSRLCGGRQRAISELLGVELWQQSEPDHYQIHDYCDYQPSRQELAEKDSEISDSRSKAGSKGAAKRWQKDSPGPGPVGKIDSAAALKLHDVEQLGFNRCGQLGGSAAAAIQRLMPITSDELTLALKTDAKGWKYVAKVIESMREEASKPKAPSARAPPVQGTGRGWNPLPQPGDEP